MRRALRKRLPALSFHFGITGEHVDTMPFGEIEAYLKALDEINAAAAEDSPSRVRSRRL